MKHFYNSAMSAPNVMTFPVNMDIVDEFKDFDRVGHASGMARVRPPWQSDIEWLSAASEEEFERFQSAFDRMAIADQARPFLDIDNDVRLYAGFIVIRSRCEAADFHVDWRMTGNEAFTLITPISVHSADFGLLYRTLSLDVAEYRYRRGEAIMFGDHFSHSTKPGAADEPVVLLSFTFGTDKMEHWPKIRFKAQYQSMLMRRPDGTFERTMPA